MTSTPPPRAIFRAAPSPPPHNESSHNNASSTAALTAAATSHPAAVCSSARAVFAPFFYTPSSRPSSSSSSPSPHDALPPSSCVSGSAAPPQQHTQAPAPSPLSPANNTTTPSIGFIAQSDPLIKACKAGAYLDVMSLFSPLKRQDRIAYVNRRDANGSTPIMHCVWYGHYRVLALLLHNGARANAQNNRRNTALHLTCEQGHWCCAEVLIRYGASIHLENWEGKKCVDVISPNVDTSSFLTFLTSYHNLISAELCYHDHWLSRDQSVPHRLCTAMHTLMDGWHANISKRGRYIRDWKDELLLTTLPKSILHTFHLIHDEDVSNEAFSQYKHVDLPLPPKTSSDFHIYFIKTILDWHNFIQEYPSSELEQGDSTEARADALEIKEQALHDFVQFIICYWNGLPACWKKYLLSCLIRFARLPVALILLTSRLPTLDTFIVDGVDDTLLLRLAGTVLDDAELNRSLDSTRAGCSFRPKKHKEKERHRGDKSSSNEPPQSARTAATGTGTIPGTAHTSSFSSQQITSPSGTHTHISSNHAANANIDDYDVVSLLLEVVATLLHTLNTVRHNGGVIPFLNRLARSDELQSAYPFNYTPCGGGMGAVPAFKHPIIPTASYVKEGVIDEQEDAKVEERLKKDEHQVINAITHFAPQHTSTTALFSFDMLSPQVQLHSSSAAHAFYSTMIRIFDSSSPIVACMHICLRPPFSFTSHPLFGLRFVFFLSAGFEHVKFWGKYSSSPSTALQLFRTREVVERVVSAGREGVTFIIEPPINQQHEDQHSQQYDMDIIHELKGNRERIREDFRRDPRLTSIPTISEHDEKDGTFLTSVTFTANSPTASSISTLSPPSFSSYQSPIKSNLPTLLLPPSPALSASSTPSSAPLSPLGAETHRELKEILMMSDVDREAAKKLAIQAKAGASAFLHQLNIRPPSATGHVASAVSLSLTAGTGSSSSGSLLLPAEPLTAASRLLTPTASSASKVKKSTRSEIENEMIANQHSKQLVSSQTLAIPTAVKRPSSTTPPLQPRMGRQQLPPLSIGPNQTFSTATAESSSLPAFWSPETIVQRMLLVDYAMNYLLTVILEEVKPVKERKSVHGESRSSKPRRQPPTSVLHETTSHISSVSNNPQFGPPPLSSFGEDLVNWGIVESLLSIMGSRNQSLSIYRATSHLNQTDNDIGCLQAAQILSHLLRMDGTIDIIDTSTSWWVFYHHLYCAHDMNMIGTMLFFVSHQLRKRKARERYMTIARGEKATEMSHLSLLPYPTDCTPLYSDSPDASPPPTLSIPLSNLLMHWSTIIVQILLICRTIKNWSTLPPSTLLALVPSLPTELPIKMLVYKENEEDKLREQEEDRLYTFKPRSNNEEKQSSDDKKSSPSLSPSPSVHLSLPTLPAPTVYGSPVLSPAQSWFALNYSPPTPAQKDFVRKLASSNNQQDSIQAITQLQGMQISESGESTHRSDHATQEVEAPIPSPSVSHSAHKHRRQLTVSIDLSPDTFSSGNITSPVNVPMPIESLLSPPNKARYLEKLRGGTPNELLSPSIYSKVKRPNDMFDNYQKWRKGVFQQGVPAPSECDHSEPVASSNSEPPLTQTNTSQRAPLSLMSPTAQVKAPSLPAAKPTHPILKDIVPSIALVEQSEQYLFRILHCFLSYTRRREDALQLLECGAIELMVGLITHPCYDLSLLSLRILTVLTTRFDQEFILFVVEILSRTHLVECWLGLVLPGTNTGFPWPSLESTITACAEFLRVDMKYDAATSQLKPPPRDARSVLAFQFLVNICMDPKGRGIEAVRKQCVWHENLLSDVLSHPKLKTLHEQQIKYLKSGMGVNYHRWPFTESDDEKDEEEYEAEFLQKVQNDSSRQPGVDASHQSSRRPSTASDTLRPPSASVNKGKKLTRMNDSKKNIKSKSKAGEIFTKSQATLFTSIASSSSFALPSSSSSPQLPAPFPLGVRPQPVVPYGGAWSSPYSMVFDRYYPGGKGITAYANLDNSINTEAQHDGRDWEMETEQAGNKELMDSLADAQLSTQPVALRVCDLKSCGAIESVANTFVTCPRCKQVSYCSVAHRSLSWSSWHRSACAVTKKQEMKYGQVRKYPIKPQRTIHAGLPKAYEKQLELPVPPFTPARTSIF